MEHMNAPIEGESNDEAKLHEELDSLQMKLVAIESGEVTDEEKDQVIERINEIEKELGLEQSVTH